MRSKPEPEPDRPVILFQTKDWRVIRKVRDHSNRSMEDSHKERLDDIIVEYDSLDGMGTHHWSQQFNLFANKLGMSEHERVMHKLFNAMPIPQHVCEVHPSVPQHFEGETAVEARPVIPKHKRRQIMGEVIADLTQYLTADVTMHTSAPFDPRDGKAGLVLTPGDADRLRGLFPVGSGTPLTHIQLLTRLFASVAAELVV